MTDVVNRDPFPARAEAAQAKSALVYRKRESPGITKFGDEGTILTMTISALRSFRTRAQGALGDRRRRTTVNRRDAPLRALLGAGAAANGTGAAGQDEDTRPTALNRKSPYRMRRRLDRPRRVMAGSCRVGDWRGSGRRKGVAVAGGFHDASASLLAITVSSRRRGHE